MLGWWRKRREARAAERDEVLRMITALGFDEAFHFLVRAKIEAGLRRDWEADAYFTRLRWALVREEKRMRELADGLLRDTLSRSLAQLVPERADLPADGAFVRRFSGL